MTTHEDQAKLDAYYREINGDMCKGFFSPDNLIASHREIRRVRGEKEVLDG
jgi:hypothetical protein